MDTMSKQIYLTYLVTVFIVTVNPVDRNILLPYHFLTKYFHASFFANS